MTVIDTEALNLLDFHKIKNEISLFAHSDKAKQKAQQISVIPNTEDLIIELNRVAELNTIISNNSFFPSDNCSLSSCSGPRAICDSGYYRTH